MNIKTPRLIIRNFKPEDWEDFLEYRSSLQVCEFQSFDPYDEQKAKDFVSTQSMKEFPIIWQRKQVAIESDWKVIGDIGLKPESYDIRIMEFGISISPDYRGKWYGKEALQWLFEVLFNQYHMHRIVAITSQENIACIKLLESLNMKREWHLRQNYRNKGKRHDEYLYAMLKSGYNKV